MATFVTEDLSRLQRPSHWPDRFQPRRSTLPVCVAEQLIETGIRHVTTLACVEDGLQVSAHARELPALDHRAV